MAAEFQLRKLAPLVDSFMAQLVGKAGRWTARNPDAPAFLFRLVWALNNLLRSIWLKIEEVKTREQQTRLDLQASWWTLLED